MLYPNRFLGLIVVLALAIGAADAIAAPSNTELVKVLDRLRASSSEWQHADAAFRKSRMAGKLSRSEFEDYAEFIAGLRLRTLEECEAARQLGGEDAIKSFNCVPLERNRRARLVVVPSTSIQTEEEKSESLNARLNDLESEIDENLLKRQQEIRQKVSNRSAGASGGSSGGGGGASATSPANGSKGSGSSPGAAAGRNAGANKGSAKPSNGIPSTASGPAMKKNGRIAKRQKSNESGSDDGVIARQLREAAEKETDPILKEKLWNEYKKYKQAQK
jgi:hypothetical protein